MNTAEMTVKKAKVKPTYVVSKTVKTTMTEIMQAIGTIPDEIESELKSQGFVMGDMIFEYSNYDEKTQGITICMGVPIGNHEKYKGSFELKQLPQFECIEGKYVGSVMELKAAWETFFGKALQLNQSLTMENVGREVYVKWLGPESNENEFLLQISETL